VIVSFSRKTLLHKVSYLVIKIITPSRHRCSEGRNKHDFCLWKRQSLLHLVLP